LHIRKPSISAVLADHRTLKEEEEEEKKKRCLFVFFSVETFIENI